MNPSVQNLPVQNLPVQNPASRTRFRFFGGKGGVGKTTCAAAYAVAAAASGSRTLVISTDPAPSLGDALGRRLGASPRPVPIGRARLYAVEIDARRSLDRWLAARRDALERVALRGTWLDEEDVARLLRLSLPGIDEIAALLEISRLGTSGRFDLIVVDTAPTGHTLRMLTMPATLGAVARVFDRMQEKHRVMVEALRGAWQPDADDALIEEIAREARDLAEMLRDPARVMMSWVTLAEPMAVEETADAVAALRNQGILLSEIIVNRVTPVPPSRCRWCDARRAFEYAAASRLQSRAASWPGRPSIRFLEALEAEPTGVRSMRSVGDLLQKAAGAFPGKVSAASLSKRPRVAKTAGRVSASAPAMCETGLVLFGGKGGVGKTTCAAAAAIAAARAEPRRNVLLISVDPAHSLADALGTPLSDTPRRLPDGPPNLRARELDAAAAFERVRDRYHASIDALFNRFSRGSAFDAVQDRRVMQELINLAPPGIDELAAVIEVVDLLDPETEGAHADLIVIDTAPSGHALRLLQMPALVQDWAKALMSILLKYQPLTGVGELGAVLLKLSQGLGRLRALLADRDRTRFVVVTRPAALPRAESVRLLRRLTALGIDTPAVVVNAVGAGDCRRCQRQRTREQKEIAKLRARELVIAPATVPPPNGAAALERWFAKWRAAR